MTTEQYRQQVADCFRKENSSYKNLLEISGQFLIENDLVEAWANLRNIELERITSNWTDFISLLQANHLGIFDFVLDGQPIRPRPRGMNGGRKPGLSQKAKKKAEAAAELYKAGNLSVDEILQTLGIGSKATLYRYLRYMNVIE